MHWEGLSPRLTGLAAYLKLAEKRERSEQERGRLAEKRERGKQEEERKRAEKGAKCKF